jgi:hypothetical protein
MHVPRANSAHATIAPCTCHWRPRNAHKSRHIYRDANCCLRRRLPNGALQNYIHPRLRRVSAHRRRVFDVPDSGPAASEHQHLERCAAGVQA